MNIDELQEVLSPAFGFFSASARPADRHASSPAAGQRNILRQNQETERQHPETQHRKKAEEATRDKGHAEADARAARLRKPELAVRNLDLAIRYLKICHVFLQSLKPGEGCGERLIVHRGAMPFLLHKSVDFRGFQDFHDDFSKNRLANRKSICITPPTRRKAMIPGSSAVEHSTVNRQVAGSNPARGAKFGAGTRGYTT